MLPNLFFLIIGFIIGVYSAKFMFHETFKIYTIELQNQYNKKLKEIQEKYEKG